MEEIKYEAKETHVIISDSYKNWTKELRSISLNGREVKYDMGDWALEDR